MDEGSSRGVDEGDDPDMPALVDYHNFLDDNGLSDADDMGIITGNGDGRCGEVDVLALSELDAGSDFVYSG